MCELKSASTKEGLTKQDQNLIYLYLTKWLNHYQRLFTLSYKHREQ